jgi:hypothetical protein
VALRVLKQAGTIWRTQGMLRKKDSWFHFKVRGYILSTLKGYKLNHFVRRISSTGVMRAYAILLKGGLDL